MTKPPARGVLRVIDESGEDFLFSADSLLATNPPDQARSSLLRAAVQRHTKIDKIRYRCHCSVLKSVLVMTMQYVTMTEFKQQASRILNDRKPTAILRNSKIEGYYVPAEFLTFDTMDDARGFRNSPVQFSISGRTRSGTWRIGEDRATD